ncbi:hypothetical protein QQF64_007315 [Cirrhinus molitorella]|uniref:Uncharacterized protein n=1 Tax=Cirrhinus molitorella TaxID=172907 RepID=A0ABR3MB01_9TELE
MLCELNLSEVDDWGLTLLGAALGGGTVQKHVQQSVSLDQCLTRRNRFVLRDPAGFISLSQRGKEKYKSQCHKQEAALSFLHHAKTATIKTVGLSGDQEKYHCLTIGVLLERSSL